MIIFLAYAVDLDRTPLFFERDGCTAILDSLRACDATRYSAASEIASHMVSTQGCSALAKSASTRARDQIVVAGMADADPHAHVVVAAVLRDRAQTVLARVAAAELRAHFRGRQIDLVMKHDNVAKRDPEKLHAPRRPRGRSRSCRFRASEQNHCSPADLPSAD